jgi:ParB family chromosome partitioning protein
MKLVELDPGELEVDEANLRRDLGDLDSLKATIGKVGILQPLLVIATPDGGFRVRIGHRRREAAVQLGLPSVPCLVAESDDEASRILGMIIENDQRLALTVSERAEGYAQLALLEWTPAAIAEFTGQPAEQVERLLTLHRLPEPAQRAADRGDLTLDDVAELEEFADDPETLTAILNRGGVWGIRHALSQEKRKRAEQAAVAAITEQLRADGVKIVKRPKDWPYSSREARADELTDADGIRLDPEQVSARPGFAAFVDTTIAPPRAVVVCTDPEGWGYTRTRRSSYRSEADRAQQAAQEREAHRRAEALAAATPVRRSFIRQTYGSAKAAKALLPHAVRAVVSNPDALDCDPADPVIRSVARTGIDTAATAGLERLQRLLVARWVAANEAAVDDASRQVRWRLRPATVLAWLDQLTADGYVLSDAESGLHTELIAMAHDDDTDDEYGDGENADDDSDDNDIEADEADKDGERDDDNGHGFEGDAAIDLDDHGGHNIGDDEHDPEPDPADRCDDFDADESAAVPDDSSRSGRARRPRAVTGEPAMAAGSATTRRRRARPVVTAQDPEHTPEQTAVAATA